MVTVRINSTGQYIDVQGQVTYVKQVSDIADVTKANSSFTWQLTFPKTPTNVKAFQMLGIAGTSSTTPYDKIICQILDNGMLIEPNGNLIITETTEKEYKGNVKAGIIDFLQDISNDNISEVIDLSTLGHLNTPTNIIDSFTAGLPYKYIIAYYNGQQLADISGKTNLNPFALVPSIDVKYLWDKIFEHYGWTYEGNFSLDDIWMTYPNAIGYSSDEAITVLDVTVPQHIVQNPPSPPHQWFNLENINVNTIDPQFVQLQPNGFVFNIQETGNYNIRASLTGSIYRTFLGVTLKLSDIKWKVIVGGQFEPIFFDSGEEIDFNITAGAGTPIYIVFYSPRNPFSYFDIEDGFLEIETRGIQQVDFSEALVKIKVKDFFKEIMIRNALTPFVDVENKTIRFRTLHERLNANVINWTDKYVERKSEKYIYESYAQYNILKHKYNQPNVDYGDGVIVVDNENQPAEKSLYSSFTYAPEQNLVVINGTYNVQNFKMFDVEVQVDENDDLIANYKQLKDRFYFIRSQQVEDDIYVLGDLATEFPLAVYSQVFADIVNDKFTNIGQLINNAKILTIDLALSKADVVGLNFYRRYYFEQERAYFILNNLTWKSGNICTGEFVKINT